ncbi:MAG: glycosyltransferase family 1 protein [Elusimicrobiales bacterium]
MKIAINTTPLLSTLTGVGNYTYQTARAMALLAPENDYSYYYGYFSKKLFASENRGAFYEIKELVKQVPAMKKFARSIKDNICPLTLKPFDLYFEPNFIPLRVRARRTVVSIMDFSFEDYPQWHPRERIDYFRKKFWKNIGRADGIIAISDFVRDEAVNKFGLPAEKLRVVRLGFNKEVFRLMSAEELAPVKAKYSLPDRFILCVGSMEPRKNLISLLKAYSSLDRSARAGFKLVFVGFKGWENKEIMELLAKVKDEAVYLGYITDAELGALYNLASFFLYPSFYEGFGLPPLEAMACGCPVVVSKAASLPEVCGGAAVYIDPHDIDGIAQGIKKVAGDDSLRKTLSSAGLERAKLFSWEKTAQEHLEIFKAIVRA